MISIILSSSSAHAILIDAFDSETGPLTLTTPVAMQTSTADTTVDTNVLGGERDMQVILNPGGLSNRSISGSVEVGLFILELGTSVTGSSVLVWDGVDGNGSVLNPTGLGAIDLTEGGTQDAFRISVDFGDQMTNIVLRAYTSAGNHSVANLSLPTSVLSPEEFVIPYSAFTNAMGSGADFTNIGALSLTLAGTSVDLGIEEVSTTSLLTATKADSLIVDNDSDTQADPGDTVLYTVRIANADDSLDAAATGVVFSSGVDPNSSLVVGSVTTNLGSVVTGNTGGDTTVTVNLGNVADDATATITFQVLVADPFTASATQISCQGTVTSDSLLGLPTDDPDTPEPLDPTNTPVDAAPLVVAEKVASVLLDDDMDGQADPGDTLQYTVTIRNDGNQNASGVVFTSGVDPNTILQVGSVTTSAGSIVLGNGMGNTSVQVNIGTLAGGGGVVTVTFLAQIKPVIPAAVTEVLCQGLVTGDNFPDTPTDDPTSLDPDDPTGTPLDASPEVTATKTGAVLIDSDGDTLADPGDTIQYTIVVTNSGDQDAAAAIFTSGVDPNTTLTIGSVTTTLGTVTLGNTVGNTSVAVNLGTIPGGGGTATVTFLAVIKNPLPAGVVSILCQGLVTGDNFPDTPTDDPTSIDPDDPTEIPVDAAPDVVATKTGAVLIDMDGDMQADPGDTLRYTVTITNQGTQNAAGVVFTSGVDPNTTFVVGSVSVPMGAIVVTGNNPGDTGVEVSFGTLAGLGGSRTLTFLARINNPVPAGVNRVLCQGLVTGDNFPDTPTDDPTSLDPGDPTGTPLDAAPVIVATKADSLLLDSNTNGLVDAGDTVQYTVVVRNNGNQNATGVVFASGVDPNTTLVVGSVNTTLGSINSGNGLGDTTVGVTIGALNGGGGTVTITFIVQVDPNLPLNVTSISCQGTVTGGNFNPRVTDDPGTVTLNDPTVTSVIPPATPTPTLTPTATLTATPTPTATVACVQAASLSLDCRGGVGFTGSPGNMTLQFHLGAASSPNCGIVDCSTDTLLVDCFLDCDQFVGTGCGFTLDALIDEIGTCITDQAGGFMTWRRVTGVGLSIQSNTPFHVCLFAQEAGASLDQGLGYNLVDGCPLYNLCDGTDANETQSLTDFTSGLGLIYENGLCPGDPTPTPTFTATPTTTATASPVPMGCDSGYYLLDSLGGRHRVGSPPEITGPLFFGTPIARDLERANCVATGTSTYDLVVLDGQGASHFVANDDCSINQEFFFGDADPLTFPEGRAVDLEMSADSQGLWVLTDFGGIYRAGTARVGGEGALVPGTDQTGTLGFDIPLTSEMRDPNLPAPGGANLRAVSMVVVDADLNSQADGYVVLDSMGGRLHYGPDGTPVAADSATGTPPNDPRRLLDPTFYVWPFFQGLDIARDIELHVTQQGVVILDGWDGVHPVPVDVESNPVYFATNLVPGSSSTPIQSVGLPYVKTGFDDPLTPEDESNQALFGIDAESVFTDLDFSAGCPDGLYTLDKFGGVFALGAARVDEGNPIPGYGNSPYFFPLFYAEDIELYGINEQ